MFNKTVFSSFKIAEPELFFTVLLLFQAFDNLRFRFRFRLLMWANPLRGQVGGGWALEIETFLSPVKWHRAVRRVSFGAQKSREDCVR